MISRACEESYSKAEILQYTTFFTSMAKLASQSKIWRIVRFGPRIRVVSSSVVLVGHDVELVKLDLRNIGVGADVDTLERGEGESNRRDIASPGIR